MKTLLRFIAAVALVALAADPASAQAPPGEPVPRLTAPRPSTGEAAPAAGVELRVLPLAHSKVEQILVILQQLELKNLRLSADQERNRVVAYGSAESLAHLAEVIQRLDQPAEKSAAQPPSSPAAHQIPEGDEQIAIVELKHLRVESGLHIIQQLLPRNARIVGDPDHRRVIVTGSAADIKKVKETIQMLDTPPPAAAAPPAAKPSALDPTTGAPYRSTFLRQLQDQLRPGQPPQPAASTASDLSQQYQAAEQEAQQAAQQWRALTAKPDGDVQNSAAISAAKSKLQATVAKAFEIRQKLQQAELLDMQRRIYSLASTIEDREKIKDQIIDRRMQDLLNPALQWTPPAAATGPAAANPLNVPRSPPGRRPGWQSAPATTDSFPTAPKAPRTSGQIVQTMGDLVHLTLGPDDGIMVGQILHVYRGPEHIAQLEVIGMQNDRSVARVKQKTGQLRPDDEVLTKERAPSALEPAKTPGGEAAGRPLSDAVREFNAANADNPLAKDQPPLTDDEVVAAIRWKTRDRVDLSLEGADFRLLQSIAESRMVPAGTRLDLQTESVLPDPVRVRGGPKLTKWAIYIVFPTSIGAPYSHVIREQFIRSEPPIPASPSKLQADGMPLTAAINGFNQRYKSHPIGKDQPPLTKDEVLTAIRVLAKKRDELPVTNAEFHMLQSIAETEQLPPQAEFEVLTSFRPDDRFEFDAWSVRIRIERGPDGGRDGGSYAYTIRGRWIRSKSIGERKIAWGTKAASGLQVGLWLDPPSEVFTKGQQVVPHFYFRNAGYQERSISLPRIMTHSYYEGFLVSDDAGATIQIDQDKGPGGPVGWTQLPFTPGAQHEVMGLPIAIGQVKRAAGVETVICAEPGQQCRLKFLLDDYLDKEGSPLDTGEVRFTVAP